MTLTLSVFLPACGATKVDDCLSERDVCELLDTSESKDLFGDLIRKIRYSKKSPSEVRPMSTQTDRVRKPWSASLESLNHNTRTGMWNVLLGFVVLLADFNNAKQGFEPCRQRAVAKSGLTSALP